MWSWAEDVLPLVGFATALAMILTVPVRPGGTFNRTAKGFFAASILCYFISTLASIMGHFNLFPAFLEPAITSVELLRVPFIVFGVYALYAHQQLTDAASSQNAVKKAGEMLESVMETAPAGIVVLNDAGSITFADGEARRLLDITDDQPPSCRPTGRSGWPKSTRTELPRAVTSAPYSLPSRSTAHRSSCRGLTAGIGTWS